MVKFAEYKKHTNIEGIYNILKELHLENKEQFHSAMIVAIVERDEKSRNAFF